MNRYFHFPEDTIDNKRVIVFLRGRSPGRSYWAEGAPGDLVWTLRDMKVELPVTKEISRAEARKLVKHIP